MSDVTVFGDTGVLLSAVAGEFLKIIAARDTGKPFRVGLTGGSLGIGLLSELARRDIDTSDIEFSMGDERWVGLGDADRNEAQAISAWPQLSSSNFVRFSDPAAMDLERAARQANQRFEDLVARGDQEFFDLLLLGVGPDGHVASLFPGHTQNQNRWVVYETHSPKPPAERLSLSFEALNRAKNVWFLAAGESKASVVSQALKAGEASDLPCAKVRGQDTTRWFIDQDLANAL